MHIIYSIGIKILSIIVWVGGFFNSKLKKKKVGHQRSGVGFSKDSLGECFWFHAASLGEFEQGKPLLLALKKEYPELKVLLTFFSPSGHEVMKNWSGADAVKYMPFDSRSKIKSFLSAHDVKFAVFVKYEFWFNTMQILNERAIPIYFISAIFRDDQHFFKIYGRWFAEKLRLVNHFFVQNKRSKELLRRLNINDVTITGDTRFDAVHHVKLMTFSDRNIDAFLQGRKCIVLGSVWKADVEVIGPVLKSFLKANADLKIMIAPHEIKGDDFDFIAAYFSPDSIPYSQMDQSQNARVLIVDKIGVLKYAYRYASMTYIGGGFGKGIHNILEPLVYGCPIIFGPKFQKFDEAKQALEKKLATSISSTTEFSDSLQKVMDNPTLVDANKVAAEEFVTNNLGSTTNIVKVLKSDVSKYYNQSL